jgi:hypothetical protein
MNEFGAIDKRRAAKDTVLAHREPLKCEFCDPHGPYGPCRLHQTTTYVTTQLLQFLFVPYQLVRFVILRDFLANLNTRLSAGTAVQCFDSLASVSDNYVCTYHAAPSRCFLPHRFVV